MVTIGWLAVWILVAPKGFYDTFPASAHLVSALPPCNEHLERDFSAAAGLTVLAAASAYGWTAPGAGCGDHALVAGLPT